MHLPVLEGTKGTCHWDDQGGSMVLDRSGNFEFVGIVQWGLACGKAADAYANVEVNN